MTNKEIKAKNESVAFVGDGVNDAPVVALSDVGIAMGGLGSDATIETADIVIQDDKPSKIPMAINIGKQTKKIDICKFGSCDTGTAGLPYDYRIKKLFAGTCPRIVCENESRGYIRCASLCTHRRRCRHRTAFGRNRTL